MQAKQLSFDLIILVLVCLNLRDTDQNLSQTWIEGSRKTQPLGGVAASSALYVVLLSRGITPTTASW